MNRQVLRGAKVLLNHRFLEKDVAVEDGTIVAIGNDLQGDVTNISGYLVPGFIDEHIHGIFGNDSMRGEEDILGMSERLAMHGVTSFLPTTMTEGVEKTRNAICGIAKAMKEYSGAQVLGVHMEGPFVSPKALGAQNGDCVLAPTMENYKALVGENEAIVRLMTLAPEMEGAEEMTKYLVANGVTVSAGHTAATYEQMEDATFWGLSQGTHLFNCMSPLHHRAPGAVGASLTLPAIAPQVISDGVHLHPAAVKLACIANPNTILITDAMEAADMADGQYHLGGTDVYVANGAARLKEGNLAGSTLTMDRAVRNVMRFAGISLEEAVSMATERVADSLHLEKKGRIRVGNDADLTLLDDELQVKMTMVSGKTVYHAK